MTNTMAKFMWCIARVDSRQYRQNSTELAPENFWIGVEIPMTSEYVWNAEEILKAELGSGNVDIPKPIYTPKALQFCLDKLGEYLRDPEPDDFKQKDSDAEDWSDKPNKEASGLALPNDEIDWSDGADKSPEANEVKEIWEGEDDNNSEEEWDETKEDWEK